MSGINIQHHLHHLMGLPRQILCSLRHWEQSTEMGRTHFLSQRNQESDCTPPSQRRGGPWQHLAACRLLWCWHLGPGVDSTDPAPPQAACCLSPTVASSRPCALGVHLRCRLPVRRAGRPGNEVGDFTSHSNPWRARMSYAAHCSLTVSRGSKQRKTRQN